MKRKPVKRDYSVPVELSQYCVQKYFKVWEHAGLTALCPRLMSMRDMTASCVAWANEFIGREWVGIPEREKVLYSFLANVSKCFYSMRLKIGRKYRQRITRKALPAA